MSSNEGLLEDVGIKALWEDLGIQLFGSSWEKSRHSIIILN
jgi:hypothetical protein